MLLKLLAVTLLFAGVLAEEAENVETPADETKKGEFFISFTEQADKLLNAPIGNFIIFYNSENCNSRCEQTLPTMMHLSDMVEKDTTTKNKVAVGEFDCAKEGEVCEKYLRKNYANALPTVVYVPPKSESETIRIVYSGFTQPNSMMLYLAKVTSYDETERLMRSRFAYAPRSEMFTPDMLPTRLRFKKNERTLVLFWDDQRLPYFWDHMALEYYAQEEKVTFIHVNCSNNHNESAEENVPVHEVCEKYAPNLDTNLGNIVLFIGKKYIMDYEGAWLAFDVRFFIETIDVEGRNSDGSPIDDIPGLFTDRFGYNTLHDGVIDLDRKNFGRHTKSGKHLIFFHIPWNWESNEMSYSFQRVALEFSKDADLSFDRVDCLRQAVACHSFGFTKYPVLMWMEKGFQYEYPFERHTVTDVLDFVDGIKRVKPKSGTYDYTDSLFAFGLNDTTFKEYVTDAATDAIVFFYTPECYGCQAAFPHYEAFAHEVKSEGFKGFVGDEAGDLIDNLIIARLDCHAFPQLCAENEIVEHPTFVYFRNGKIIDKFDRKQDRTVNNFLSFLLERAQATTQSSEESDEDDEPKVRVVKQLTSENFEAYTKSGISVIAFIKNNCDLCTDIQKPLTRLAFGLDFVPQIFTGSITVGTVNCDSEKELCHRVLLKNYGIPAMQLHWNGDKLAEVSGKGPSGLISDLMNILPLPKVEL